MQLQFPELVTSSVDEVRKGSPEDYARAERLPASAHKRHIFLTLIAQWAGLITALPSCQGGRKVHSFLMGVSEHYKSLANMGWED